ncbi:MAG: MarR family transcriptional regulator [Bacteriovoracaceae bacterium]|nr:MarR family transcriptional regulator [Bacteriovoracaceae bacterium]
MKKISNIGSLLKKIYRMYSLELLSNLQARGFTDLRPSFLEILMYLCENQGPTIKEIGVACGLKKQTMTSHLNELEKRGYIIRKISAVDKREQNVFLTEYGEKFKFNLLEVINDLESNYSEKVGAVELDRVNLMLENLHRELQTTDQIFFDL